MTDEKNLPEKKIFSEGRGKYTVLDGNKVYHFDFPIKNTIEENLAILSYLKDKILAEILKKEENKDNNPKNTSVQGT